MIRNFRTFTVLFQIKETRKALKDTERDLEKMAIGHHIHDRGHVIERRKNTRTNDVDERQNYMGIDESKQKEKSGFSLSPSYTFLILAAIHQNYNSSRSDLFC